MNKAMIAYAAVVFAGVFIAGLGGYVTLSVLVDPFIPAHALMDTP
jgi:hypothetical protein